MSARRLLSRSKVKAHYDRVGTWQDTQAFYQAPAFDALLRAGCFHEASSILEVGCGTGRLAECLLRSHCPTHTRYEGYDLSEAMVQAAQARLATFGDRAIVHQTDGQLMRGRSAGTHDRVLATYLLDLLPRDDARTFLDEAHRCLREDGRLCLAGLTWGTTLLGKGASGLWNILHRIRPEWVGGCRPLRRRPLLEESRWAVQVHTVVRAWGVPSEVLVAVPV